MQTDLAHVPQPPPRKRKRALPASASSPAPSDPGIPPDKADSTEVIPSRADLFSRPRLSISRGPVFIPTAEGSEYYKTDLVAVNRIGFRYCPAGINPPGHIQPCRTIESNPTAYRVSWEDRSPSIKVSKDGLDLAGSTGFRSARCNAPVREGRWYMEVKILHGGGERLADEIKREGAHVRLGWGRREAPLNGPVGLDGYSYGYRDKTGEKVTLSRPRQYGQPFNSGDVVGMYISLPPRRQPDAKDPHDPAHVRRERIPIDLKGQEMFEMLEYPQSKEMTSLMDYSAKSTSSVSVPSSKKTASGKIPERGGPTSGGKPPQSSQRSLPILANSRIAFFVNGQPQGTAFEGLYDYLPLRQTDISRKGKEKKKTREGVKEHRENPFDDGTLGYYPFISLFNDASIRLNPGPDFEFPPPPDIDALLDGKCALQSNTERVWRPICERYPEYMQEQWTLDEQEEQEARAEIARIAANEKIEAEKQIQRAKKRQQAEERKRAKAGTALHPEQAFQRDIQLVVHAPSPNLTPNNGSFGAPSPSPLRCSMAYDEMDPISRELSPLPSTTSENIQHNAGAHVTNSQVTNQHLYA